MAAAEVTYWPEFLIAAYVYTGVGRCAVLVVGNYRCDMQGYMQHVQRATGTPDDLQRLQKQLLIRVYDMRGPGGSAVRGVVDTRFDIPLITFESCG